jgi:hypothetical protein
VGGGGGSWAASGAAAKADSASIMNPLNTLELRTFKQPPNPVLLARRCDRCGSSGAISLA